MSKNTPGSKYHRTEQDLANDLSLILAQAITPKMKHDVIDSICWKWTEQFGKYEGRQCSVSAHKHYRLHGDKDLRHDHSIPKTMIIKMLSEKRVPFTTPQMLNFLKEFCVAVIITKGEDKVLSKSGLRQKMPKGWKWTDPYARYKAVGIKISKDKLGS